MFAPEAITEFVLDLAVIFPGRAPQQNGGDVARHAAQQDALLEIEGHIATVARLGITWLGGNPANLVEAAVAKDEIVLHGPPAEEYDGGCEYQNGRDHAENFDRFHDGRRKSDPRLVSLGLVSAAPLRRLLVWILLALVEIADHVMEIIDILKAAID